MPPELADLTVLVLAPVGRDATLICGALSAASIHPCVVNTIVEAVSILGAARNIGTFLVTEEVLNVENIAQLRGVLATQPAWSDLPVLILTLGGLATALSRQREHDRLPLSSVTLLERPIRSATLISAVRSALRSRSRQYQVRDTLLERDRADAARRETENRLLIAIETARLGSWELNLTTGALEASDTCRSNFDLPPDEPLTYQSLLNRIHPEDLDSMQAKIRTAVETRTPYAAEYRILWRNGTLRWISASGRRIESMFPANPATENQPLAGDLRMAGVTLDITDRVLSELALRNADKLALVGRLSSSIAHEINNPLESVTNLLYLLAGSELGPVEREYVATAQSELARITEIAAQTLTFNRRQNAHEQAILTDILDSVLALFQGRLATSGILVERNYTFGQPVVCYPGEIRQVFTNLVGNAFDATRKGGRILLRERLATHPCTGQKGTRITVADSGSGIPPEVKHRLFEAFYSTKGNNGTGLGLWISQGIARKHGGSLRFSSSTAPGRSGSVFALFLPLT